MPRQTAIAITNNFTKGLVTTASPLAFPENACADTDNCSFTLGGTVDRRPGIDIEASGQTLAIARSQDTGGYSEFVWTNVGGVGNKSLFVVQSYKTLYFYDITSGTSIGNALIATLDFSSMVGTAITADPGIFQCQFAQGTGYLFVTNQACDPFYVAYVPLTNTVSATRITIQTRDLLGMTDTIADGTRPVFSLSGLLAAAPSHYYNLFNQGWGLTTALTLWDSARSDMPSNRDYNGLYRSSPTVPFDNSYVGVKSPGNTLAAKGHFILNEFDPDRSAALLADGLSALPSAGGSTIYSYTIATPFVDGNNIWVNTSQISDGITGASNGGAFTTLSSANLGFYAGVHFATAVNVANAYLYFQYNVGGAISGKTPVAHAWPVTIQLFAKNTLPANATDGTLMGNTSALIDTTLDQVFGIVSGDAVTTFKYWWVSVTTANSLNAQYTIETSNTPATVVCEPFLNEFQVASSVTGTDTPVLSRPSTVAFYTGRVFYSGQESPNLSSNIYFSQIIESSTATGGAPIQAGYCYQQNDPTSEQLADLESSDGGVIQIQDMGVVKKLYVFRTSLIVFATNGVWLVTGSQGAPFAATDYVVKKLTNTGTIAPNSVVNFKGTPLWWAEDAIYTLNYNANYDSYDPQSLSIQVIDEFFNGIPVANRQYVKGIYSVVEQIVYWLYNDNPNLPATDIYKYNRVLLLNGWTNAFYPWTIPVPDATGPYIRGIAYIQDGVRNIDGVVKYVTTKVVDSTGCLLYYSDMSRGATYDWTNAFGATDSPAYFTTSYRLDGKTQTFFQPGFVFIFFATVPSASCYVQAYYDYALTESTNKFSTPQQAYLSALLNRKVNFRRLKVRGKGRALQLHFTSESGKPFSIYGWSLDESGNATD